METVSEAISAGAGSTENFVSTLELKNSMELAGAYRKNVEVIGYCDMRDRPAFMMCVREAGGHWYLYSGQFSHGGAFRTRQSRAEVLRRKLAQLMAY